jgi:hypothetical protein
MRREDILLKRNETKPFQIRGIRKDLSNNGATCLSVAGELYLDDGELTCGLDGNEVSIPVAYLDLSANNN